MSRPQRWLLAGASGFLGTALRERLAVQGHDVVRLVRREPATASELRWDPAAGQLDEAALDGVDFVVSLGGVGVFTAPWTAARREAILASRVDTTTTLARAIAQRSDPPTFISASGIARYGIGPRTEPATEDTPAAADFLAQVTVHWEAATQPAAEAGARTILLRTSPVLDRRGGPFLPMRLAWSAGLGTTLGDGRQHMPLIALEDYLGVVQWAADTAHARGPYNLTLPVPTTNAAFTDELAHQLGRPRLLRAPAGVLRLVLGELSGQLLGDMWVLPTRLSADGYRFRHPDVATLVRAALGRSAAP